MSPKVMSELALTYLGGLISVTFEHTVCSSAQSNLIVSIWSRLALFLFSIVTVTVEHVVSKWF